VPLSWKQNLSQRMRSPLLWSYCPHPAGARCAVFSLYHDPHSLFPPTSRIILSWTHFGQTNTRTYFGHIPGFLHPHPSRLTVRPRSVMPDGRCILGCTRPENKLRGDVRSYRGGSAPVGGRDGAEYTRGYLHVLRSTCLHARNPQGKSRRLGLVA
jgi:hypothetical protein